MNIREKEIYHYTNGDALKNILDYSSLYASSCSFLNDKTELNYGKSLIDMVLNSEFKNHPYFIDFISKHFTNWCSHFSLRVFFISFSTNPSSSALWYNYSSVFGYNIKLSSNSFDNIGLRILGNKGKDQLATSLDNKLFSVIGNDVEYDFNKQIEKITPRLYDIFKIYEEGNDCLKNKHVYELLIDSVLYSKMPDYRNEEEYRIAIYFPSENYPKYTHYRVKSGIFVPYIEVVFLHNNNISEIPIQNINIGPAHDITAKIGLLNYLLSKEYFIKVNNCSMQVRSL